jgi:XTP/dITP diphosphohydrolase
VKLFLATRNDGKLAEMRRILDAGVEVVGLDAVAPYDEPVEDRPTFEGNALLKARAGLAATGLPSVADDSGLCVDALNGMPGVLSARWAGSHGDDGANLRLVLDQLSAVPDELRGASFVCAAALALPTGEEHVVEGRLVGSLVHEPRGSGGFGYDPVFVPEADTRTTAEMSAAEKNAISHRGNAFRALAPAIRAMVLRG